MFFSSLPLLIKMSSEPSQIDQVKNMLHCTTKWWNSMREFNKASQAVDKIRNDSLLRGKATVLLFLFKALNGEEIGTEKKDPLETGIFQYLKNSMKLIVVLWSSLSLFAIIDGFMFSGRYLIRKYNTFFSSVSKQFLWNVCAGCIAGLDTPSFKRKDRHI